MEQNTYFPEIDSSSKIIGKISKKNRIENIPKQISGINPSYIIMKNRSINNSYRNTEGNYKSNNINNNYIRSKTPNNSSKINSENESLNHSFIEKKNINFEIKPESNIFDYLYLESKIIQDKKNKKFEENIKKKCPFKPIISRKTNIILKNKKESKGEYIKRMSEKKNLYEEIIISQNKNYKKKNLEENNIKKNNINPNEYLKTEYNQKINNENILLKNRETSNIITKKQVYLKNTMEIIIKTKIEKIRQIFNLLDSDHDGFISNEKIQLSNLNEKLLSLLTPFLEELYSNKELMTFREFYDKVEPLFSNYFFN